MFEVGYDLIATIIDWLFFSFGIQMWQSCDRRHRPRTLILLVHKVWILAWCKPRLKEGKIWKQTLDWNLQFGHVINEEKKNHEIFVKHISLIFIGPCFVLLYFDSHRPRPKCPTRGQVFYW